MRHITKLLLVFGFIVGSLCAASTPSLNVYTADTLTVPGHCLVVWTPTNPLPGTLISIQGNWGPTALYNQNTVVSGYDGTNNKYFVLLPAMTPGANFSASVSTSAGVFNTPNMVIVVPTVTQTVAPTATPTAIAVSPTATVTP